MSYSPRSTSSGDTKPIPDQRYADWDKRSRKELTGRLYEAVDKRLERTQSLIPQVIEDQLNKLSLNETGRDIGWNINDNVTKQTHQLIDKQINDWKGLRWWRFNEKNVCDSYTKYYKKAKCWQDQNQHKPLGHFWCLIFDELKQYTSNVSQNILPKRVSIKKALQICLYNKCVLEVFKGSVRFERTRETPLLPVRTLAQSKELQNKLESMDRGFTLSSWKQEAENKHKQQKRNRNSGDKNRRSNVATILNERCCKHAMNVYRHRFEALRQMLPNGNDINISCNDVDKYSNYNKKRKEEILVPPNMDTIDAIISDNVYRPTRGHGSNVLRCESQRFSPLNDAVSISSRSSNDSTQKLHRTSAIRRRDVDQLTIENEYLRAEIAMYRRHLSDKRFHGSRLSSIPSPMRVRREPINVPYDASNASMFYSPNIMDSMSMDNDINEPPTGIEPYLPYIPYNPYWNEPFYYDRYYDPLRESLGQHPPNIHYI